MQANNQTRTREHNWRHSPERRGCCRTVFFLEPNTAWNYPSVCVSCERVSTSKPEGQGLTITSARPLWKLPVQCNSFLRSLPLPLGCPTSLRKQLSKDQTLTDSHKLSTATAEWRCLTPSLATGPRPVASAYSNTLSWTGIIPECLAGTRDPETSPELSRRRLMRQYIRCRDIREFQPLSLQPPPGTRDA